MVGVLNEVTKTVHKHKGGRTDFQTECGSLSHISHDNLRIAVIGSENTRNTASKCGRCFDDAGGY